MKPRKSATSAIPRRQRRPGRARRTTRTSALVLPSTVRSQELKCYTATLAAAFPSIGTAGTSLDLLQYIVQGTDANQRIGREIYIHDIRYEGTLSGGQVGGALDDAFNTIRICCFQRIYGTGVLPLLDTVLQPQLIAGLERVLSDQRVTLDVQVASGSGYAPATKIVRKVIRVNRAYTYVGAAGVPSTLMLTCASDSAAVPNPGFVDGSVVVSYLDL